jgi:hypothetical protein
MFPVGSRFTRSAHVLLVSRYLDGTFVCRRRDNSLRTSSFPDLGISSSVVSTFMQEVYMCLTLIDRLLLPPREKVPRSWPSALNIQDVSTSCSADMDIWLRDLGKFETVFGGLTAAIA